MNHWPTVVLLLGAGGASASCNSELLLGRDLPGSLGGGSSEGGTSSLGGEAASGGAWGGETGLPLAGPQCDEMRFLRATPRIDGALDDGMILEDIVPVGWYSIDGLERPHTHSMKYASGWRPDGLYFYAEVVDADLNPPLENTQSWLGDSVAFFVDHDGRLETPPPDYAEQGTRQITISSPANQTDPGTASEIRIYTAGLDQVDPSRWISLPRPAGYVVEAFIVAKDLSLDAWQLEAGDYVGFDVGVNVSLPPGVTGGAGRQAGSYFLSIKDPADGGLDDLPIRNESAFCRARLL